MHAVRGAIRVGAGRLDKAISRLVALAWWRFEWVVVEIATDTSDMSAKQKIGHNVYLSISMWCGESHLLAAKWPDVGHAGREAVADSLVHSSTCI